ncbi:hypothetical protein [Demequina sp. NBRC 110052]|uniref:hypothetical protein n=1 Tax=Demequina sp. NBRC 110052 TaxID=1570341 RepID=UPI0009FE9255|nr:hypothetical protein [Demequina sp. NBRC 110052]
MAKWSTGEKGIAWLGVGIALIVVAPVGFDGAWTGVAVVLGAIALAYGGWLAWTGMRKDKDDAPGSDDEPTTPES